jgi:hypothetical protein
MGSLRKLLCFASISEVVMVATLEVIVIENKGKSTWREPQSHYVYAGLH